MKRLAGYFAGVFQALFLATVLNQAGAANVTVTTMHDRLVVDKATAPLVELHQGRLSVRVNAMKAADLLAFIASQGEFVIEHRGSLQQRVSLEFYQLPLWQGLQQILGDRSFALQYPRPADALREQSIVNPSALWIFDQVGSAATTPLHDVSAIGPGEDTMIDIASLQNALGSARVEDREAAVAYLGDSDLAIAVGPLSLALLDEDEGVRELAVEALAELDGPKAIAALAIAIGDSDPAIREEAIDALGAIGGTRAIELLEQALADEEEFVRDAAREWLEELTSGDRF